MGFTSLEVVTVGVVHRMAALPAEIGHKQQAVQRKSHHRFHPGVGMEGSVPALVGKDPATCRHRSRGCGVEQPEGCSAELQGDQGSQSVGQNRQAQGHGQTSPCLNRFDLVELEGQAGQQFSFAGIAGSCRWAWRCGAGLQGNGGSQ